MRIKLRPRSLLWVSHKDSAVFLVYPLYNIFALRSVNQDTSKIECSLQ